MLGTFAYLVKLENVTDEAFMPSSLSDDCDVKPKPILKLLSINLQRLMDASTTLKNAGQLARAAGVDQKTIWRILNHANYPALDKLEKIAVAYRLTPAELLAPGMVPAQPLSFDAQYLGRLYDQITDETERQRAWSIAVLALRGMAPPAGLAPPSAAEAAPPPEAPAPAEPPAAAARKRAAPRAKPRTPARR